MPDRFNVDVARALPSFVSAGEEVAGAHPPGSNRRPADYESCEVALSPMLTVAHN
jgi:hypothetical protein